MLDYLGRLVFDFIFSVILNSVLRLLWFIAFWPNLANRMTFARHGGSRGFLFGAWLVVAILVVAGCCLVVAPPAALAISGVRPALVAAILWWWAIVTFAGLHWVLAVNRST